MSMHRHTLSVEDRKKLIQGAFEAKKGSYSPYSHFPVGAALLTADGRVIGGANVDAEPYGGTICAERTAIVKAVSEGTRSFVGLAIVTNVSAPISPCGLCRQVLREFCAPDMPVLLVPGDYPQDIKSKNVEEGARELSEGGVREYTLGELLPDSFGREQLELLHTARP